MSAMRCRSHFLYSMSCIYGRRLLVFVLIASQLTIAFSHQRQAPGCRKLAHTQVVRIPGCVMFRVTTNACRGYCVSYAYPSSLHTLALNPSLQITSRAECCGIVKTYDKTTRIWCLDGYRNITFKSASECECSICRE